MSYVDITVRVDTREHSFAHNEEEARAMVENMLNRDPRFRQHGMSVVLNGRKPTEFEKDVRAWNETADEDFHNLFTKNNREQSDGW